MTLKVSTALSLPVDVVTHTIAILAMRGVGKTHTATKIAEEMVKANLPVCVIDPIGVWWGLRSNRDGTGAGLPVVILGGDHADVPLESTSGVVVADFVIEARQPCVLDLSLLRKGEQQTFMLAFCERLYHKNRDPLHLVIDEADAYAPQRAMHGSERLLGAVEDLVRRGRARGIGLTLITQRAAVLNKNVLTQVDVLVAMRTVAPQDRAAIDEWIKVHGTPEQRETMMASLSSLPVGTAWFWSPGWLDIFVRVAVDRRETFDSSATPKVGMKIKTPKTLAPVDLDILRERMAATIEKAKAEDPRELRRQIADLKRQVKELEVRPAAAPLEKIVEIPIVRSDDIEKLRGLSEEIARVSGDTVAAVQDMVSRFASVMTAWKPPSPAPRREAPAPVKPSARPEQRREPATGDAKLGKAERAILTVLAQHIAGRTKKQIAIMTGYAGSGGSFNNALSSLRTAGFLAGSSSGIMTATDAGLYALGTWDDMPDRGPALREHWKSHPSIGKAERLIIDTLADHPRGLSKSGIAERTGYEVSGGAFNNAVSRLCSLELARRENGLIILSEELL